MKETTAAQNGSKRLKRLKTAQNGSKRPKWLGSWGPWDGAIIVAVVVRAVGEVRVSRCLSRLLTLRRRCAFSGGSRAAVTRLFFFRVWPRMTPIFFVRYTLRHTMHAATWAASH